MVAPTRAAAPERPDGDRRQKVHGVTVHPLVAEVVLDDLPGPVARDRLESAAVRLLRQAADRRDPGHPGDPWVANLTGRHDAAALAFRTLYADQERALGPTHPHTLRTRGGLVRALLFGGEPDSAADLAATLRAEQQAVLGRAHPDILHTRASQALADATAGRSERAEEALGELIVEQEALLGSEHPSCLINREHLGWVLQCQGRTAEARQHWLKLELVCTTIFGIDHPQAVRVRRRLIKPSTVPQPPLLG